jgi:hypothetical protein
MAFRRTWCRLPAQAELVMSQAERASSGSSERDALSERCRSTRATGIPFGFLTGVPVGATG